MVFMGITVFTVLIMLLCYVLFRRKKRKEQKGFTFVNAYVDRKLLNFEEKEDEKGNLITVPCYRIWFELPDGYFIKRSVNKKDYNRLKEDDQVCLCFKKIEEI